MQIFLNYTQTPVCGQKFARTWTAPAHRTPHPHRQTAPAQMSPHKFSPQTRFHDLSLKTFASLQKFCGFFSVPTFFPAEKHLYFLKMGKHASLF